MKADLELDEKLIEALLKEGKRIQVKEEILAFGDLIYFMRKSLRMTQQQLAKLAKVPQSTIQRIEKGLVQPNESTLRKIFNAMECDIALVPISRFKTTQELLRSKAKQLAEKKLQYLEGTMALEKQQPTKKWRERLLEIEIERILKTPSILWDETGGN